MAISDKRNCEALFIACLIQAVSFKTQSSNRTLIWNHKLDLPFSPLECKWSFLPHVRREGNAKVLCGLSCSHNLLLFLIFEKLFQWSSDKNWHFRILSFIDFRRFFVVKFTFHSYLHTIILLIFFNKPIQIFHTFWTKCSIKKRKVFTNFLLSLYLPAYNLQRQFICQNEYCFRVIAFIYWFSPLQHQDKKLKFRVSYRWGVFSAM